MEGEPCGCTGGVGADAVHDCDVFVSGVGKKRGSGCEYATPMRQGAFDREDKV